MMKLSVTVIASLSLIAGCKKEEPKKTPEQNAAEARKALGGGSGSAAVKDLGAALGALAAATGASGSGSAATGDADKTGGLAGALGALSALGGGGSGSGGGGLGEMLGGISKLAGAATLSTENQAIVNEYNLALNEMNPVLVANAGDCVKLGTTLAPLAAKHAGTFAKMKGLQTDESQKVGLGLAMATGPTLMFLPAMMAAASKCKDSAEFQGAWEKIKDITGQ